MPCSDGYHNDPAFYEDPDFDERLTLATQVACELARALRSTRHGSTLWDELPKQVKKWVERHDRIDAARIKREKQEKKRAKLRTKALKKLSRKEREVLGV